MNTLETYIQQRRLNPVDVMNHRPPTNNAIASNNTAILTNGYLGHTIDPTAIINANTTNITNILTYPISFPGRHLIARN